MNKSEIPVHKYLLNSFIIINVRHLEKIPLGDLDMNNGEGVFTKIRKHMKLVTNYGFDNGILALSNIYGYIFSFNVAKCSSKNGDYWSINAWDQVGTHNLYSFHMPYINDEDFIPASELQRLKKSIEEFTEGKSYCSDCKKSMPASRKIRFDEKNHETHYGGQYFAGHYCNNCWENKWKAIEAKENYN
jgi:hypothetical protein